MSLSAELNHARNASTDHSECPSRKKRRVDEKSLRNSPDSIDQLDQLDQPEIIECCHEKKELHRPESYRWTPESRRKVTEISRVISRQLIKSRSPQYEFDPDHLKSVENGGKVASWREATVIWYLEVAERLKLPTEFIETAVNLLDRYLARVSSAHLLYTFRIAAAAALMCTGKHFTLIFLSISQLVSLCGEHFLAEDLLAMERHMLFTLKWCLTPCTAAALSMDILDALTVVLTIDKQIGGAICDRVRRILEISYSDYKMLRYPILCRAWSSIQCALKIQDQGKKCEKKEGSCSMEACIDLPKPERFAQWHAVFNDMISLPDEFRLESEIQLAECEAHMTSLYQRCMESDQEE